jgi:hypothetical protein
MTATPRPISPEQAQQPEANGGNATPVDSENTYTRQMQFVAAPPEF